MAGQMEVVGGGLSCLVARHESAQTIASRSSSMDADAYFVQPSPVLQMQMDMEQPRQSQQHAQGQSSSTASASSSSSTAIECTASNEKFPQHVIKDLQRPQKLVKCPLVDDVASPSIKTSNFFFCFTFFS